MAEIVEEQKEQKGIKFFGEADLVRDKETGELKIAAQYPSWYFTEQKRELEDSIRSKERQLEKGLVNPIHIENIQQALKKERDLLNKINASEPKFKGFQKDKMAKIKSDLGEKIADSMYTYSEMMKGTADAHEEAHRMSEPIIQIDADTAELAKANNIIPDKKNKISRNQASKLWKMLARVMEESSNVEVLRKD